MVPHRRGSMAGAVRALCGVNDRHLALRAVRGLAQGNLNHAADSDAGGFFERGIQEQPEALGPADYAALKRHPFHGALHRVAESARSDALRREAPLVERAERNLDRIFLVTGPNGAGERRALPHVWL